MRAGAAPTTPGRVGTARRLGSGKQDGKVYERRNQWWNPRKASAVPKPGGYGPVSSARPKRATPTPMNRVGWEAMRKDCDVLMARLPGKSWAPPPSTGTR
jgi:hypothetical protein